MERISLNQICWLIIGFYLGTSVLLAPAAVVAGADSWISVLLAGAAGFFTFAWLIWLLNAFPGQDIFNLSISALGPLAGRLVTLYYVLFFFFEAILVSRNNLDFANVFFVETPETVVVVLQVAVACYAVRLGLEAIARFAELLVPWAVGILLLMVALISPLIDLDIFTPVLLEGWTPVAYGALLAWSFPFAEIVTLSVFIARTRYQQHQGPWLVVTYIVALVLLIIRSSSAVAILGPAEVSAQLFPLYAALRLVDIFDFIQRIDFLIIAIFSTTAYIKFFVGFYVSCRGLGEMLGLPDFRILVFPLGIFMVLGVQFGVANIFELAPFNQQIWPVLTIISAIILPIIITAGLLVRRKPQDNKKQAG